MSLPHPYCQSSSRCSPLARKPGGPCRSSTKTNVNNHNRNSPATTAKPQAHLSRAARSRAGPTLRPSVARRWGWWWWRGVVDGAGVRRRSRRRRREGRGAHIARRRLTRHRPHGPRLSALLLVLAAKLHQGLWVHAAVHEGRGHHDRRVTYARLHTHTTQSDGSVHTNTARTVMLRRTPHTCMPC